MVVLSRQDTGVPCPDFVEEPRRKYGVDELSSGIYHLTNHNKNGGCLKFADTFLVGGLEHFLSFHILGIIIPTDFHIFQRGRNHQPDLKLHFVHGKLNDRGGVSHGIYE